MPYVASFYVPRLVEVSEAFTVLYLFDATHQVGSDQLAAVGFPEAAYLALGRDER